MPYGLPWSEDFIRQLSAKAVRDEFVADQVRTRIALMTRALREQEDRQWTQTELGQRAGKTQNVISRLEDPDYGRMSLQTLLEVAAAFDLPLWVDIPEWDEWFRLIGDVPNSSTRRTSFSAANLADRAAAARHGVTTGTVGKVCRLPTQNETSTVSVPADGFTGMAVSA